MIQRDIENELAACANEYPVITITGPRQSGKTTLARYFFKTLPYINFEDPLLREYFSADPKGFLTNYKDGAVFDEVQHLPSLTSFLQVHIDEHPSPGRFVLTGSQHFGLTSNITQSLAGRTALLELLPFSLTELKRGGFLPEDINKVLLKGAYPPIFDRRLRPARWYTDYIASYIQRDVRQISQIHNLDTFTRLLRIVAGQVGQLLNTNRLGSELGVDHKTVIKWINILQASYILRLIEPYHTNFRKRIIKTPKIYFYDTGLVCNLLGILNTKHLETHPLRGELFENWVFSELVKGFVNRGQRARINFWRTHSGQEIDFILETGRSIFALEVKSGMTVHSQAISSLQKALHLWKENGFDVSAGIIYSGREKFISRDITIYPWYDLDTLTVARLSESGN